MVPLWFFMSLWMVDTRARLLCHLGASCPLHQRRNFPGKFASSPVPDANEVQNLLQDLWAHLWTGILRNPCSSWRWLSWCVFAAPTSTWGWNPARPWAPQGAEPVSSQLIPHSSLNLALRWVLISGWQVSPTVLFLKLSNYSWAFYTNCRNCLKPSVWNLGQILVRISSNYWINFRELWCLCGLSLVNIGAIFLCFLEVRVNKLFPCTLTVPFRQSILGCLRRLFSLGWCCDWGILSCYIFEVNAASPSSTLSPPALLSNLVLS